jgi:hypothetical protein
MARAAVARVALGATVLLGMATVAATDGVAPAERAGTSDLDFVDAHAWVERIRRGDA